MSANLYSKELMRLAADATGAGSIEAPDGSGLVINPLCGDRIKVEIRAEGDRILALAHEAKACVICQAAASMLAQQAIGATIPELKKAYEDVQHVLETGTCPTTATWPQLAKFTPIFGNNSRYRCLKLPFEALFAAIETLNQRSL